METPRKKQRRNSNASSRKTTPAKTTPGSRVATPKKNGENEDDFDTLGVLPSVPDVQRRINSRFDELFHVNPNGERTVHVCVCCDEILMHRNNVKWLKVDMLQKRAELFRWETVLDDTERIRAVEEAFKYEDFHEFLTDSSFLKGLALSPRATLGKTSNHGNAKWGFSCCNECHKSVVDNNVMPLFSIVNRNFVGCAPDCLTDLNPMEVAMLTPIKGYGYCFTHMGGENQCLRGTMTFMRVEPRKVARAAVHLEAMGLTKHVVVLLSGKMTAAQIKRVKSRRLIRTEKILAAVEWLAANHKAWREINLDEFRKELEGCVPEVVDRSHEVDSTNANIEEEELFSCYFPDGSNSEYTGGFNTQEEFKHYADEMAKNGYNIDVQLDLQKQFLERQDEDNLLVNVGLLQFPYGVGGLVENRELHDGSTSAKVDLDDYLQHLSKLSQPVFHHPLFTLIVYSQASKVRLLKRACLQARGKKTVESLSEGVTEKDVRSTVAQRGIGNRHGGTSAGRSVLNAVDAVSSALPHTDEAAKKARSTAEGLQHHFGIGSQFFTVTFDDDCSLLLQFLCEKPIDDDRPLEDLTDEELRERTKERKSLRLDFPGMSSINFEMLLYIVCEEVVGWDIRKNKPSDIAGLFGECYALSFAIEEQGRKTLHVHFMAWIKGLRELQKRLFWGEKEAKRIADNIMSRYHSRLVTTDLIETRAGQTLNKAFDHECSVPKSERSAPETIDDQGLRDLRHRLGYTESEGKFAFCPHCDKVWTAEELINQYVRSEGGLPEDNTVCEEKCDPNVLPKDRLQAKILQFQKEPNVDVENTPTVAINALYQCHDSKHRKGCFKCQKSGKKSTHTCGPTCECRMRLPDRARKETVIRTVSEGKTWYYWTGDSRLQPLVEFLPARRKYDCFQNKSCKAVSESKFTCNTNLSIITDGPVGQYQFKYHIKPTSGEDTNDYCQVCTSIKHMGPRKHDDDSKESVRIICRAAFAHNKRNVIGAPMASWLTRNGSRFYFSHKFVYCPLNDLMKIHDKDLIDSVAKYCPEGTLYFENQALHYLCRPPELDYISVKEFYEKYTFRYCKKGKRKRKKRKKDDPEDDPPIPFQSDTGYFKHPSAFMKDGQLGEAKLGVKLKPIPDLLKISGYQFPDSAKFGGNLLSCKDVDRNMSMEKYAQAVLTLFCAHRSKLDLMPKHPSPRFPYLEKFREVYRSEQASQDFTVFSEENLTFLQNIQDCHYNSMRYKVKQDDLQSATLPFSKCTDAPEDFHAEEEEEEEETNPYEDILQEFEDDEVDTHDENPEFLPQHLKHFTFKHIRNKGTDRCGQKCPVPLPTFNTDGSNVNHGEGNYEHTEFVEEEYTFTVEPRPNPPEPGERRTYSRKQVVEVFMSRCTPTQRKDLFKHNPDFEAKQANGSVESIYNWAEGATLDPKQRRAFEAIVSSFLLTFYEETTDDYDPDVTTTRSDSTKFRQMQRYLKKLRGQAPEKKYEPLVCLMHGPGGSGKSTVINLVTAYAREYCDLIGHPFTSRTIVITAMSGVAATLLHGETAHKAMGLNRNLPITNREMIEAWKDARLLIIDEISFAGAEDFEKMHECCKCLMESRNFQAFGGLNVVFAGDYSQLEPVGKTPVYTKPYVPTFHGMLNAFIELNGHHRFRDDPEWGNLMFRTRQGLPTVEDIQKINANCVIGPDNVPPVGVQVACQTNRDRDAVNSALFEEYCQENKPADASEVFEGAVLIFMADLEMKNSKENFVSVKSNAVKKHFYTNCSEDGCYMRSQSKEFGMGGAQASRVDPVLKLYPNCPMMLTMNTDVPAGEANGTRLFLEKIVVVKNEKPMKLKLECGTIVRAYLSTQIKSLIMRHEVHDIIPQQIEVHRKSFQFTATIPLPLTDGGKITVKMKGEQFPIISNTATTGHKLQGYTAKALLANVWYYGSNWAYVVMSRVTTMKGLFMRNPLELDLSNYEMPQAMKNMLAQFEVTIGLKEFTEDEYSDLLSNY